MSGFVLVFGLTYDVIKIGLPLGICPTQSKGKNLTAQIIAFLSLLIATNM